MRSAGQRKPEMKGVSIMESNQTALVRRSLRPSSARSAPHSDERIAVRRRQDALLACGTATRRAIIEEVYDSAGGFNFQFVFMYAARTCGADVYLENERKLERFLRGAKQRMIWTRLVGGGRVGQMFYASRNIREFHRWVYVNDLLVSPEFDPKLAAKQFSKTWQSDLVLLGIISPKPASIKRRDTKGDLTKALIALDKQGVTNRVLLRETIEITRRSLAVPAITRDVAEKHSKRVYDAFRNNKELSHRKASKKKK